MSGGRDLKSTSMEPLLTGARFDRALRGTDKVRAALAGKRIRPAAQGATPDQARGALFAAVAEGRPVLSTTTRVPVARESELGVKSALLDGLSRAFKPRETASAQVGRNGRRDTLAVRELLRRWASGRHVVSITDLHVRGTRLERDIDTAELSRFNLLPLGTDGMRRQEMMTLVVSSRGNVTDSHSDDPDGSNHCFVGRKLWLAWETFEGRRAGLQDCSRDEIDQNARFDLAAFASLKSASWWTVSPGETLFLPGRLSHRVVTLESYLGIGSFYCTPASGLENLSRWYHHGALWSLDDPDGENRDLVDDIAMALTRKLRVVRRQTRRSQERWGLDCCALGLSQWQRRWSPARRGKLLASHPHFAELVEEMQSVAEARDTGLASERRAGTAWAGRSR